MIVFVNAISALRRLLSLLKILQLPVEGLHGNMQQRARLKYLDRFRAAAFSEGTNESSEVNVSRNVAGGEKKRTSVLVATDVAARGIDIKGVDLVVHYQVPTSADTYVHRSGRTGRARAEGRETNLPYGFDQREKTRAAEAKAYGAAAGPGGSSSTHGGATSASGAAGATAPTFARSERHAVPDVAAAPSSSPSAEGAPVAEVALLHVATHTLETLPATLRAKPVLLDAEDRAAFAAAVKKSLDAVLHCR